jgi:glycerol-3-phosphate dehydrogenase
MYDVIVIGAGVIGAAAAREIARLDVRLAVLEAKADVAMGASGANSAIVHAGYDAKPGTVMARTNVAGNRLYDTWKEELHIPFVRNGALVLAFDEEDMAVLHKLYDQGVQNGVTGQRIISAKEAREMEPALSQDIAGALCEPMGGITCPYQVTVALMENAAQNGAEVFTEYPVTDIKKDGDHFEITTPQSVFQTKLIVNCAGVRADRIARMLGDTAFSITPRRGEYCLYDKRQGADIAHTLFQPPGKMGKGVLVTPTVDGNLLTGPTAQDIEDRDDTATTDIGIGEVLIKSHLSVPALSRSGVIRTFAGLRAQASTGDFVLGESGTVPGLIHGAGICSPGLSAAPAIGIELAAEAKRLLACGEKDDFDPIREAVPSFRDSDWKTRERLIRENPHYGRIVCRCETVTEAEIVAALHRPLPARTLDAVKRRTRAGMGRCQGGFCTPRIMEIMARELGIPILAQTKKGGASRIVTGRLKEGGSHA